MESEREIESTLHLHAVGNPEQWKVRASFIRSSTRPLESIAYIARKKETCEKEEEYVASSLYRMPGPHPSTNPFARSSTGTVLDPVAIGPSYTDARAFYKAGRILARSWDEITPAYTAP
jgi:hypothetical protein